MKLSEKQWLEEYKKSFINLPKEEWPICLKCSDEKLIACMSHKDLDEQPKHEREDVGCLEFKAFTYDSGV